MKREFGEFARIFVNSWLLESDDHARVDEQGREQLQRLTEKALRLSYDMGVEDQRFYGKGGFWHRLKRHFLED